MRYKWTVCQSQVLHMYVTQDGIGSQPLIGLTLKRLGGAVASVGPVVKDGRVALERFSW